MNHAYPKKSEFATALATLFSVIFIYFLIYSVANKSTEIIVMQFGVESFVTLMILDATISFLLILAFFYALTRLNRIYANFVIWTCAIAMYIYWGVNNGLLEQGYITEQFPAWYEINLAFNELIAAFLVTVFTANKADDLHADVISQQGVSNVTESKLGWGFRTLSGLLAMGSALVLHGVFVDRTPIDEPLYLLTLSPLFTYLFTYVALFGRTPKWLAFMNLNRKMGKP